MSVTYVRPLLYPKQEAAVFTPARYAVCEATTKSGKTISAMAWLLERALLHGAPGRNFWWVAPQYEQAGIAFERYKRGLPAEIITRTLGTFPQRIVLANGASLSFRSADKPDSLYGEDVHDAVVDEYTRTPATTLPAMMSVTTATGGMIRFIGNVVGRGSWGYGIARKAEAGGDPDWAYSKLSCLDAVAGLLEIGETAAADRLQASVHAARASLSAAEFAMLYMAEAPEDDRNPLDMRQLDACTADASERPTVCYGLDLARARDFTELVGFDAMGQWTTHWRTRGGEWGAIKRQIGERIGKAVPCLVDSTGVGDAILDDLAVMGCNVSGFKFTGPSRRQVLSRLVTAINAGAFSVPRAIAVQLESLRAEYTASGVDYRIPEPLHDDGMMALALAIRCFDETVGVPVAPSFVVPVSPDRDTVTFRVTPDPESAFAESFGGLGAGW